MTADFILDHCKRYGHEWREIKLNLSGYAKTKEAPGYEFRVAPYNGFKCFHCGKHGYISPYEFVTALGLKMDEKLLTAQSEFGE